MSKYRNALLVSCCCFIACLMAFETKADFNLGSGQFEPVNPNSIEGMDTERIHQAIKTAKETNNLVRIPKVNANGTTLWMIDSAILLPGNITLILDNCTLQLSPSGFRILYTLLFLTSFDVVIRFMPFAMAY